MDASNNINAALNNTNIQENTSKNKQDQIHKKRAWTQESLYRRTKKELHRAVVLFKRGI